MHTSYQLHTELFDIRIDGAGAGLTDLFPNWSRYDRVGVVANSPFGLLGAKCLSPGGDDAVLQLSARKR